MRQAVEEGITHLDVAPAYGDGEAERVIGEALGDGLPDGVRVTTKCRVGNALSADVPRLLERSLDESSARMKLEFVDLFVMHSRTMPDDQVNPQGTPRNLFVETVRPALERMVARGRIGAWGMSAIGTPSAILQTIQEDPPPAAILVITNLLNSPGGLKRDDEPARPREIIAEAGLRGIGVMGIRAVQAGALTDAVDRELPDDHPEMVDYRRAAPFRAVAKEIGESPASLAHRYALSMEGVSTVILGVKNRTELRECIAAAAIGPLDPDVIQRIDLAVSSSSS